jgi:uncharacterized protein YjiS (DUF1127 family)
MSCAQTAVGPCRHGVPPAGAEAHLRRAVFGLLLHSVSRWFARSRQRRDLAELDAHLLRDIGVTPGEAAREAAKPFWVE